MLWLQHRLCLARTAAAACKGLVLKPVNGAIAPKAVTASQAGSFMLHGRMDPAAAFQGAAVKSLLLLLWRPSVH